MTDRRSVAIIGGGMMGCALAYYLGREGYAVTVYEGEDRLGGLAASEDFGPFQWDRFYHCILPTDDAVIGFLQELGLGQAIGWSQTGTGVYIDGRIYPLNTMWDFARFTPLNPFDRFRLAMTLVRCSLVRNPVSLERFTAKEWFTRVGGRKSYERIWLPLLRAKFGDSAGNVSPVFLVAKVKRMLTSRKNSLAKEKLGFISGGYAAVWSRLHQEFAERGTKLRLSTKVEQVVQADDGGARVVTAGESEDYARAVFTLPFEVARRLTAEWPGINPVPAVASVDYMGLVCLILALRERVTPVYVLNLADEGFPFTGVIGLTNLIGSDQVNGLELLYVPKYAVRHDPVFARSDEEIYREFMPHLRRVLPALEERILAGYYVRRARVVQPVQVVGYSRMAPQPLFRSGPISIVNNSQLLEADLHNSAVIEHARHAADAIVAADRDRTDA